MAYKVTEEGRTPKLGAKAREAGGAAMRGTDNAFMATQYAYGPAALAANTNFVPPNNTIILTVALTGAPAGDFLIRMNGAVQREVFRNNAANVNGTIGCIFCDGTLTLRNDDGGAAHDLVIRGLTMT